VAQFNTDQVAVVDTVLKTPRTPITVGDGPVKLALKPTGSQDYLYVLNQRGNTVSFVNRRSGSKEVEVSAGDRPDDFAISPDGKWLFITNPETPSITRINVASRLADQTLPLPNYHPRGIAVHPICEKDSASGNCNIITLFVVSDQVTQTAGTQTKTGKVGIVKSQLSGMSGPTDIQLNGAEKPMRVTVDGGGNVYVSDLELGNGIWLVPANTQAARVFGSSPVGLTYDIEVTGDGSAVYASIPRRNQYVQIKAPEGTALLFPDTAVVSDTFPEPLAFNSDQSELWIGFVGNSAIAYATIDKGRPKELRAVVYTLNAQTKDPPKDILLAGGI
jgi:DNA-binding beta-propeller fold protein YncE